MCTVRQTMTPTPDFSAEAKVVADAMRLADFVVVGAGAGLSASAGYDYEGPMFKNAFADFIKKYGITDGYGGGFYPYPTPNEFWAFFSRLIYLYRYTDPPKDTYKLLLMLLEGKDYFVITTNVDHCFQKAGFDKKRLFYTQGDYGLWQCSKPCSDKTYDNREVVARMVKEQKDCAVPQYLLPVCPLCGAPMTTNLRCDDKFAEDDGWREARDRYHAFLDKAAGKNTLFLELGVGYDTPGVIKYPFWRMTAENPSARFISVNIGETFVPGEIADRSLVVKGDIHLLLSEALSPSK